MNILVSLLNGLAVSFLGSVLAATFCGALSTPQNRRFFWCGKLDVSSRKELLEIYKLIRDEAEQREEAADVTV